MARKKEEEPEEPPIFCPWCGQGHTFLIGKTKWGAWAYRCTKCDISYFVENAEGKIKFRE